MQQEKTRKKTPKERIIQVFGLKEKEGDFTVLPWVLPVFAAVTAATVITISFSKALFLGANDASRLPWMFITGALVTMIGSLAYVSLVGQGGGSSPVVVHGRKRKAMDDPAAMAANNRLYWLLLFSGLSYAAFIALTQEGTDFLPPWLNEQNLPLLIFAWCAGVGNLMMIQTWSWGSAILNTRQAKRLFPIFATMATMGAILGGLATKGLLAQGMGLNALLLLSIVVVAGSGLMVRLAPRRLPDPTGGVGKSSQERRSEGPEATGVSRIPAAFVALYRTPLLVWIAMVVFLIQIASVVLETQFASALKIEYGTKEDMAAFMGLYYAVANIFTLFLGLVASGGRITLPGGIGVTASSAAIVLAVGGLMLMLGSWGMFGLGAFAFWTVVISSLGERVAGFALGKQAQQAAVMPVKPEKAEPARFLIDGVFKYLAVVLISAVFLLVDADLERYESLAPLLLVSSILAVAVGYGLKKPYGKALISALARLGGGYKAREFFPEWAMSEIYRTVSEEIRSPDIDQINRGLGMAKDFRIPLEVSDHARLLTFHDTSVVIATLEVMSANQTVPSKELALALLEPGQMSQILCATMRLVPQGSLPIDDAVRRLAEHEDETVSAHAVWWLRSSLVNTRGRAKLGERVQARRRGVRLGPTTRQVSAVLSEGGGMADELTDRYVYLVDKIPVLMNSDSEENRRLAMEMLEELGLPEHAQMLITGLDRAATRSLALLALKRMPPDVVLPQVFMGLRGSDDEAPGRRIHLLLLAEAIGGEATAMLIAGQMNASAVAVRDQAVKSLWRLSRNDPSFPLPERTELVDKVTEEIQHLVNYALFDVILAGGAGRRQRVLRRELGVRRSRGEDRVFRLLAMIYAHEPVERAHRNYRKANRRTRSNAIELLDTTITDSEIKPFVDYVEGSTQSRGQTVGQGITAIPAYSQALQKLAIADDETDPVEDFLGTTDTWLLKVYRAAVAADKHDELVASGQGDEEMGNDKHDDVMERLFLLRGVALFENVPADQLLPLAEVAKVESFEAGEVIFEQGEPGDSLYIVQMGEVELYQRENGSDGEEDSDRFLLTMGREKAFGEMAILDSESRSAKAMTREGCRCLVVDSEDFGDLLDIAPGLAKGVMKVLSQRVRESNERLQGEIQKRLRQEAG